MNKTLKLIIISILAVGCMPVHLPTKNEYRLMQYSVVPSKHQKSSILITPTEAVAGYQTKAMLYMDNNYTINSFAYNAWAEPPADMIYSLIIQSVVQSKLFKNVASGAYASVKVDYRLDTQLLELQQNFVTKPSILSLKIKASLINMTTNKLISSKIFSTSVKAKADNPYAGVVAANKALQQFTLWLINNLN